MSPRTYHFPDKRNWNELKIKVLEYITTLEEPFEPRDVAEALSEKLPRIQMELLRLTRQNCLKRYRAYRGVRSHPYLYELKPNAHLKLDYLKQQST